MRKRIKKYLEALILILLIAGFMNTGAKPCHAAGAKVDLITDQTEVTIGSSINVDIKISSDAEFTSFESNLTYDESVLEYKSGPSTFTGGSGYLKISDISDTKDTSRKYTLKFKAVKTGSCNISFGDDVIIYDESGNELPVSSDNLMITVKAEKTASANAQLKSMEISPADLNPSFDKGIYDYKVNVDNDTDKLIISAIPEDEKAKVSISGNDFLKEGENKVVVSVLAESGNVIEYTINVFREAAPTKAAAEDNSTVTPGQVQNTFNIIENNGEKYAAYSGLYKLTEPGNDVIIPAGYSKVDITISGVTVAAYVPVNNPDSEFVLLYAENASGTAGFYKYDKTEKTLQRYTEDENSSDTVNTASESSKFNKVAVVIALLITLCIFLIIAVIWLLRKQNCRRK